MHPNPGIQLSMARKAIPIDAYLSWIAAVMLVITANTVMVWFDEFRVAEIAFRTSASRGVAPAPWILGAMARMFRGGGMATV
jgi:lysylphosphatidylglycerol synthetase-like protein (DUF2156 family)